MNVEHLIKEIAYILSWRLYGNKVIHIHTQYNCHNYSVSMRFKLEHKEWFGDVLSHEIYYSDLTTPEKIVNDILLKTIETQTIETLPRADRLERIRMWRIK